MYVIITILAVVILLVHCYLLMFAIYMTKTVNWWALVPIVGPFLYLVGTVLEQVTQEFKQNGTNL